MMGQNIFLAVKARRQLCHVNVMLTLNLLTDIILKYARFFTTSENIHLKEEKSNILLA